MGDRVARVLDLHRRKPTDEFSVPGPGIRSYFFGGGKVVFFVASAISFSARSKAC